MATSPHARSVPELFSDLVSQVTTLLRKETQLARTELAEKVGQAAGGLALAMVGAVLLIPALTILLTAAVTALVDAGLQSYWAALIVGGVVLAIGLVLLLIGVNRARVQQLLPARTIQQFRHDATVVRQQVRQTNDEIQRAA